jgi:dephospho-CoA kinase
MGGAGGQGGMVIGVTGCIGSGKSRVSRYLARQLVCPHVDADQIARELMAPGKPGWLAIKGLSPCYIRADGQLDRGKLRHDIFADASLRARVDSLVHPLVRQDFLRSLAERPGACIVAEVPLLFEAGWDDLFDVIVLVYAARDVCIQRVVRRDGVDGEQAARSYGSQLAIEQKIARADHVIDNSGSWWNSQLQLLHLVDILTGQPL